MTDLEVLIAAKALLSDPTKWTQGVFARNSDGDEVDPDDSTAVCWCATGAVRKIAGDDVDHILDRLKNSIPSRFVATIPFVNDGPGYDAVMEMYDIAIAAAK